MDILGVRKQINVLMNEDQKYHNAVLRKNWQQGKVIPFIKKNLQIILADNEKGGEYLPEKKEASSPFAMWLLVQHMDAFPLEQEKFLKEFQKKYPKHSKLQFLKDRVAVNKRILVLSKRNKYYDRHGKLLKTPTVDVRDPRKFLDADTTRYQPTSARQALENAKKHGNSLLVQAVESTTPRVKTQPSFFGKSKS